MIKVREVYKRLALIQLVANCIHATADAQERHELTGLIESLCRHYDVDVDGALSPPRLKILNRVASPDFGMWQNQYASDTRAAEGQMPESASDGLLSGVHDIALWASSQDEVPDEVDEALELIMSSARYGFANWTEAEARKYGIGSC